LFGRMFKLVGYAPKPWRSYIRSIFKYLPYINQGQTFSAANSEAYAGWCPEEITRERLGVINGYAAEMMRHTIELKSRVERSRASRPQPLATGSPLKRLWG